MHQTLISSARGHSFVCAAMALAVMVGCTSVPPAAPAAPALSPDDQARAELAALKARKGPGSPKKM